MSHRTVLLDLTGLRLHRLAEQLLAGPNAERYFALSSKISVIETLPDGTVLSGIGTYMAVVKKKQTRIAGVVREDLVDEDPAMIAGIVIKDLLNGTRDLILYGAAWEAFNSYCTNANRPRSGYPRRKYERRHTMSPVQRLRDITVDTFGYSDDQLRRYARLPCLPCELQDAFRRGAVTLRALVGLSDQDQPIITAVLADVLAGMSPADAISKHVPLRKKTQPSVRTALRRFLAAGVEATANLAGRHHELGSLEDSEREQLARTKQLVESLLTVWSTQEMMTDMARTIKASKPS